MIVEVFNDSVLTSLTRSTAGANHSTCVTGTWDTAPGIGQDMRRPLTLMAKAMFESSRTRQLATGRLSGEGGVDDRGNHPIAITN